MIVLGLTGSIGMGKSTTAGMFAELGVPVHDSDATVHALYSGEAAGLIERAFPGVVREGTVDRAELGRRVLGDGDALARLEAIIHPLVRARSDAFLEHHGAAGTPLVVLDIPLLFETRAESRVDRIAVVSAPADLQRRRVLERPGMTVEKFETILAKQIPDEEKRRRADFVIETGEGLDLARRTVADIVHKLGGGAASS